MEGLRRFDQERLGLWTPRPKEKPRSLRVIGLGCSGRSDLTGLLDSGPHSTVMDDLKTEMERKVVRPLEAGANLGGEQ